MSLRERKRELELEEGIEDDEKKAQEKGAKGLKLT